MTTLKDRSKIRFTVGFSPDQARRLDELHRTRQRKGETTSRADLVREAVGFYLQHQPDVVGSRRAITKDLEGKIDRLDAKVEDLFKQFTSFVEAIRNRQRG